jgi:hypothetical protein
MFEILRAQRGLLSVRANAKYNKKGGKEEMRRGVRGKGMEDSKSFFDHPPTSNPIPHS